MKIPLALCCIALTGCVSTSSVMEAEGGMYMVSARAAPAAGGASGANSAAYEEAKKFCATKGGTPVVVDARDRDTYQGGGGASWSPTGGSAGGGFAAWGNANLRFRCK